MPKWFGSRNSVPLSTSLTRQMPLVHISEMAWTRTNRVEDLVAIGDEVDVKIIKIDEKVVSMLL